MSWSHSVYLEYTSIIPYAHVLHHLWDFLTILHVFFTGLITTSSQHNSVYTYIQSKHYLHVFMAVCVCIFISMLQSCVLFLSWHVMTEVFVTVLWLADCCGKVMPSQASWRRYYRAGETISSQDKIFLLLCISELMHSSANALQVIYRLSVACGKEACVFHFSQGLVSWIYTSYVTLKALIKPVD